MTLYMIGIGLSDEKDISLKALDIVKRCDFVYLEEYTSKMQVSAAKLEHLYGKKTIIADRDLVENKAETTILRNAKENEVAFLVIGDVFSATTHVDLLLRAKKDKIKVKIIHNVSILTAIGEVGLELYKFGRVASIPFNNKDVKTPLDIFKTNYKNNLHTLFLFDLDPAKNKYMQFTEVIDYLIKNGLDNKQKAVACAALGSDDPFIKSGKLENLKLEIKKFPQCLIIPAKKLHFVEEEALELYA